MPICAGCGASFANSFQFCPHCGRATPKPQSMEVSIKETIPSNACPICQRNDRVEKVSVIFMHGSHDTSMSIPVTEINSDSQGRAYSTTRHEQVIGLDETKLAQALRPPTKPEALKDRSANIFWVMFVIYICGFPMFLFTFFRDIDPNIANSIACLGLIIVIIFCIPFYLNSKIRYKNNMANYNSSILPSWERSLEVWNSLYFCHRDGCVFKLGEKVSVTLEKWQKLLV